MALDWATVGTKLFDLRPDGSVGQAATLGAAGAATTPSGAWSALPTGGGFGFPPHVACAAGPTAFGFGPVSDGSTAILGCAMNTIALPTTSPEGCSIAVLGEFTSPRSDVSTGTSDGRQNAGIYCFESGGTAGLAYGMNRKLRYMDGSGPGSGDWWAWEESACGRIPCNLQLIVVRRTGDAVTINTSAADQQTLTSADAATAGTTASMSVGTLQNNNTMIGKIARVFGWSGALSDSAVAQLFTDVYSSGGLSTYTGELVLLGDSITAGRYAFPGESWVDDVLVKMHALGVRVWNYARSGEKLNGALNTVLATQIADTNSSTLTQSHLKFLFGNSGENFPVGARVVIMLGANDLLARGGGVTGVTGAVMAVGLQAAAQLLKSWGARVYVMAPTPVRNSAWAAGTITAVETVRQDYITAAAALVGSTIDGLWTWQNTDFEPVSNTDANIAKVTQGPLYQLMTSTSSLLMHTSQKGDGIHPGRIGHRVMGSVLTNLITDMMVSTRAIRGIGRKLGGMIQRMR